MKIIDHSPASPDSPLRKYRRPIALASTIVVLILFGDTLLPTLGHALHLLIEIIELPLEHLLEWAFHLSPRQAQAVLAWSAFILSIYLTVRLVRYLYLELQRAIQAAAASIRALRTSTRPTLLTHPATALTLTVGLLSAVLFMVT